jgi:hypothetical protein
MIRSADARSCASTTTHGMIRLSRTAPRGGHGRPLVRQRVDRVFHDRIRHDNDARHGAPTEFLVGTGAIAAVVWAASADTLVLWDDTGRPLPDPGLGPIYDVAAFDRYVLAIGDSPHNGNIIDEAGIPTAILDLPEGGSIGSGPGGFVTVSSPADYYENPSITILEPVCTTPGG